MIFSKLKNAWKSFLQKLIITFQLYGENGLANHAAACAYGFLFSMAPMLLLIVSFILYIFKPSGQTIIALMANMPFIDIIFDEQWLTSNFLSAITGLSGILSVAGIFWSAGILGLSIKRGLKIIFPPVKKRNAVINTFVSLALEIGVLVFILIAIIGSRTARRFYLLIGFSPKSSVMNLIASQIGMNVFYIVLMGLAAFFIYLYVPENTPRRFSAFCGALLFVITSYCTAMLLGFILNISRINFLYGALGNIIILLVNVYFFFTFFFLGAQLVYVIDSFDSLLFSKLRQIKTAAVHAKKLHIANLLNNLIFHVDSSLSKYLQFYKKNEIIFSQGSSGDDIYYLLEGEVEVLLSLPPDTGNPSFVSAGILTAGSFFGEMGYLLSENRAATIKALANCTVFSLPPSLFETIIKNDTNLDIEIIEHMSRRLKNTNQQIIAIKSDK